MKSRATTIGKWLFAIVVPFSGLALGAMPAQVLVAVAALAAVACGLLLRDAELPVPPSVKLVLVAFGIALGFTALQAIPLPHGLCQALAPANADVWERVLAPLKESVPAWHTLSVTPGATRVELLKGTFYLCLFLSALRIMALDEGGSRFLVRLVMASATVMALATLAHAATSADTIFGLYRPRETYAYREGHLSPLLNTNHLAAYLVIGACVSLGAVFSKRTVPPVLAAATALVCAATSFSTVSRGATGSLVVGGVLVLGLALYGVRQRTRGGSSNRDDDGEEAPRKLPPALTSRISIASIAVAACLAAGALIISVSVSETSSKLLSDDLSKVDTAKSAANLVKASPIFGFGRGSFETVFPSVQRATVYRTWTHPEDIVVQWFVEWGVPVTVVLFLLFAWALRPQVLLRPSRPMVGPWVAIVATLIHEIADFHLEVPGVAALVVVCIALVTGTTSGRDPLRSTESLGRLGLVTAGATALVVLAVIPQLGHSLAEDRRALGAASTNAALTTEAFRGDLRAALLRHPAEPFLPLMGAVRAQSTRDESIVPWIGRALERNEHFGRAHFVLARELASRFPAQARLEYRLAYTYDRDLRAAVVKEATPLVGDADAALELVPDGTDGLELLEALVVDLAPRMPSTAVILDAEIERRSPKNEAAHTRRVAALAIDAITDAPWCAGTKCLDEAFRAVDELVKAKPEKCEPHILIARLRIKRGDVVHALDTLQETTPQISERGLCERRLIELAQDAGDRRRVDFLVDRLVKGGCGAAHECIELHLWAAGIELQREHWARAVGLYRRVLEVAPERDDLLEQIGELGEKPGVRAEALDAYRTLAMRHPNDARWPARTTALSTLGLPSPVALPSARVMAPALRAP